MDLFDSKKQIKISTLEEPVGVLTRLLQQKQTFQSFVFVEKGFETRGEIKELMYKVDIEGHKKVTINKRDPGLSWDRIRR